MSKELDLELEIKFKFKTTMQERDRHLRFIEQRFGILKRTNTVVGMVGHEPILDADGKPTDEIMCTFQLNSSYFDQFARGLLTIMQLPSNQAGSNDRVESAPMAKKSKLWQPGDPE